MTVAPKQNNHNNNNRKHKNCFISEGTVHHNAIILSSLSKKTFKNSTPTHKTYFDSINFCDEGSNSSTSTCTPFPIVELTTACFKYFPDAPDGFSFVTTIIIARKLSSNFDCEKLTLPKERLTGSLTKSQKKTVKKTSTMKKF